ncbi:MAG: dihydrofolate reductase [Phyllobacterium sp.]
MQNKVPVSIVVVVAQNGVIGRDNDMPWRLSTDLKRFRALTMGKPVIMGRKTWNSLGRPLPGRSNIVISRDAAFRADGADVVGSLDEAAELANRYAIASQAGEICVIGGGEIYRLALPVADTLHVTRIMADIDGDTFFPAIDAAEWHCESAEDHPAGEKDSHPTRYIVYRRIPSAG